MKDILQQIQNLKEDFMNLIEVEGLGQPASDVPPSTNKIKKDRKTKNGKVELVSVEDELFPYDGTKREQYRQKIIDTINGMIQGTATLEDLLQIVREKKALLKEAFELMEDLYATIKSKHGEPRYEGPNSHPANKSAELINKMDDVRGKEFNQAEERDKGINLYNKRFQTKNKRGEWETKYRSSKYKSFSDYWRPYKTDKDKIEGSIRRHASKLEEALKLLEGLFVNDGRKDLLWNDIAGRSDTPISAASNALKNKIDKACKGTQKKMPVKEGLDKFEIVIDILEEMINEVSVKDAVQAAQNSIEDREKAHQSSHWCGDNYREKVAKELSSLPKSERNIKQLVNAARNSLKDRRAKWSAAFDNLDNEEGSKGDLARASKRRTHANIIAKLGAPKTNKEKTL